jgi:hypothetical protein
VCETLGFSVIVGMIVGLNNVVVDGVMLSLLVLELVYCELYV